MPAKKKQKSFTIVDLLNSIETEALDKGSYNIPREGLFRCTLRAAFVRAYQFAAYCSRIEDDKADEGCFFMASALRGTCEDLIVLKFIRQLPRKLRDEVIEIEMSLAVNKAVLEQTKFFGKERPFQPVLSGKENNSFVRAQRARLHQIGATSGLWETKNRLPPVEQMASMLKMKEMYDYFYRVTSDVVHFNPRISLRHGWGSDPKRGKFSTANFALYYLKFCQIYSVLLFTRLARTFAVDLNLSKSFRAGLTATKKTLESEMCWPEAVTFDEMNQKPPSIILALLARVMWDDPKERRKWKRGMAKARRSGTPTPPKLPAPPEPPPF
jgi:hypothetical protein